MIIIISLLVNLIQTGFVISVIFLVYLSVKKKDARKAAKYTIALFLANVVMYIAFFAYSLIDSNKWIKQQYSDIYASRFVNESLATDVMVNQYRVAGYNTSMEWFQSDWYSSVEELAFCMPFDTPDQYELFVDCAYSGDSIEEYFGKDLNRCIANDNREVLFYEVDLNELEILDEHSDTVYLIVVDQDTLEAAIAAFHVDY